MCMSWASFDHRQKSEAEKRTLQTPVQNTITTRMHTILSLLQIFTTDLNAKCSI